MGITYARNQECIEIIVRDYSGAKIESFKCFINDKKKYKRILDYLKEKYGFEPEINAKESINNKEELYWWA